MKLSNEILEKMNNEKIKEQMIESFRMGSGLKDKIITRLFCGDEVSLPKEIEIYLNLQIPNWFQQNLERKKNKKNVA